jgi:N-acetylglutamate synthase-like GNAT family acetyltransferase/mannose-6-phosphate isomerase-like protein (cupin superfamily)
MPLTGITFRPGAAADVAAVRALLDACGLPSADVSADRQELVVALEAGALVGCIALERYGAAVLLRSLAVAPGVRRRGVGRALHDRILATAALRGATAAYLLTTTAEQFAATLGFERVERSAVPGDVAASPQLRGLCPSAAVCMRRDLRGDARHYPADVLRLRADVPGASMWAVALERAMLTYFEVAPRSRFEAHRHASEQITFVIDGELFFEVAGGPEVRVGAGEVIAVPGDVPHRVWTRERPARAVDAWSPVRPEYLR